MSDVRFLAIIMPIDANAPIAWCRFAGDIILDRGGDLLTIPRADDMQLSEESVVVVTPAQDVTVNWAALPGLVPAQARAAARLLASENSISPIDSLHIAVGEDAADREDRLIATVDRARMDHWLERVQAIGFDPDVILPASLLLRRPEQGHVRGDVFGQRIIASRDSVFADEAGLTELIVGDAPIETLPDDVVAAGIGTMLANPPVNLRQGQYARKRRWQLDWPLIKRLAMLGAGIAIVTLLINLSLIVKYDLGANAVEARTANLARTIVPGATSDEGAIQQLDERLSAERGGGAGFAATTAAIFSAVQASPNVELTVYDFGVDGTLRITVAAATPADHAAFVAKLEKYGFSGQGSPPQQVAGRFVSEMTVKAR